ncbi:MAG: DUF4236 domain-containing protein [Alphaproteobacteria bacterium]|nr:DUF4236 domain-containing protein [Alphaproteobacteria bacterium]
MGLRFQKRVSLFKGLTLNLSKGGASVTVGKKGASINVGKNGVTGNAGIPGTGVSYREKLSGKSNSALGKAIVWLIVIGALGAVLGGASLEQVVAAVLSVLGGKG